MLMVVPLLLVISIFRRFGLGFVIALIDTVVHNGFAGGAGVVVGTDVAVGTDVLVRVGGILVAVGGLGVKVIVGESVGDGRTRSVFVGANVIVGMGVSVCVGTNVGVDVISFCISPCASSSDTGVISRSEQKWPVIVQAVSNSSWVSGSGSEGELTD